MARCGCNKTCNCVVTAGCNATVTGNGSTGNPYRVAAPAPTVVTVTDSGTVDLTATTTPGATDCDPDTTDITAAVIFSTDAGNTATTGSDGGVFVGTPGSTTFVDDDPATPSVTVTGTGTDVDPFVVHGPVLQADPANPELVTGTGTPGDPWVIHCGNCGAAPDTCTDAVESGCGIAVTTDPVTGCKTYRINEVTQTPVRQFAILPPVTVGAPNGVAAPAQACGAPAADLTYTNNTCGPVAVTMSIVTGQRTASIHGPNSQVQSQFTGSVTTPDFGTLPFTAGGGALQVSNRIAQAPGGIDTAVMSVSAPPMQSNELQTVLQPGQSVTYTSIQQCVEVQNGVGSGRADAGYVQIMAIPL